MRRLIRNGAIVAAAAVLAACAGEVREASVRRAPKEHRAHADACDHERPLDPPSFTSPGDLCQSHADCTDGENGRCLPTSRVGLMCSYDLCFTDTDCAPPGNVCACGEGAGNNTCLAGDCRVDADCSASGYCSPSFGSCGHYSGVVGYFCHTSSDECIDDADCTGGGYCALQPTVGHWQCSTSECVG